MNYFLCDLDGVVWSGTSSPQEVHEAFSNFDSAGLELVFVSNNSFRLVQEMKEQLQSLGYKEEAVLVTSSIVTASYLPSGSRILAEVGPGTVEQLQIHNHQLCAWNEQPDYVVMGLVQHFNYELLDQLMQAVTSGAQLIATNDDPTFPTANGIKPGGGSLVSAVATAAGVTPIVIGKPHDPIVNYVMELYSNSQCLGVIGDRYDQDGRFSSKLKLPFYLVESDATKKSKLRANDVNAVMTAKNFKELSVRIVNQQHSNEI